MPESSSSSPHPRKIDVSSRLRRADRSRRIYSLLYLFIGGAGIYFCYLYWNTIFWPGVEAKREQREVEAILASLETTMGQLSEWSTEGTFENTQSLLDELDGREGVDPALLDDLWTRLDEAWSARDSRLMAYESLMEELQGLPSLLVRDKFVEMEDRVAKAKYQFEKPLFEAVQAEWNGRRDRYALALSLGRLDGMGELVVRCDPERVNVFINERLVGETPLAARLKANNGVRLELRHPRYQPHREKIDLRSYDIVRVEDVVLVPRVGEIELKVEGARDGDVVQVAIVSPNEDGDFYYYANTFYGTAIYDPESIIGRYEATVFVNGAIRGQIDFEVLEGEKTAKTFRLF